MYRSYRSSSTRSNSNQGFRNRFPRRNYKSPRVDIYAYISRSQQKDNFVQEQSSVEKFADFNLLPQVEQAIVSRGYIKPTPIQAKVIPEVLLGRDILGLANTGTGKTDSFLIPTLHKILTNQKQTVLIVSPTRELAEQINHDFYSLARGLGIYSVLCIGGTSLYRQRRDLSRKHNVIIGTPGRILDLINQKALNLSFVETVVLDEVDRMFDMGFVNDMKKILANLPQARQSLFFSATVTPDITNLIKQHSSNMEMLSVKTQESAATVEQDVIKVSDSLGKVEVLRRLLSQEDFAKVLIFGRTKHGVQKLSQKLSEKGFRADAIHGNKSQSQRQNVLSKFRQNKISILVATDVAARGLDIPDITHVINFDVPATYEDYIHRIGRTGRSDCKGKALTFVG